MKYTMRKPCAMCPFRADTPPMFRPLRALQVYLSLEHGEWVCHESCEADEETSTFIGDENSQHCAGALILLEREERSSQMMRIAERLGDYDASLLDMNAPVYESAQAYLDHAETFDK